MEILDTASSLENTVSFDDAEVAVVKVALKTKLFNRSESVEVRTAKFKAMVDALAEKFGVPQVSLAVAEHDVPGYCDFDGETNTLRINRRFSLTNTLCAFAMAMIHHKPELMPRPESLAQAMEMSSAGHFNPLSFALSMFKQAAPIMFESAKASGRLCGTNVQYTDGGRLTAESHTEDLDGGDDSSSSSSHDDGPPPPERPVRPQPPLPRADIDPENRRDRGNGLGED